MIIRADDIPEKEIQFSAMRASGPGGQHVNKTSNAVHLKFDILSSSLPRIVKDELLSLQDSRITSAGLLVIKAGAFRSQEKNRSECGEPFERPERPARSSMVNGCELETLLR